MNTEVEQRIVEMRFDNEQFEKAAKQSLGTLEKLDNILDMLGQGGIDKLSNTLDEVQYRFSTLGVAGAAAIENIANRVINLTARLATMIPDRLLNQIQVGGEQRALNIENAKFQLKGLAVEWEDIADDIDHAVMGTAYGVDEAAKIAAILAASKVDFKNAKDSVSDMGIVLRSISGLAAMTNSSYEEIGNLMGDIFAMGKLSTRQLQSFELRGLNVAAKLSEMLKRAGSDAKYTEEEIREMVSKGQIDALTFAKAMDAAFGEHATAANETYTGSLRNMNAALSRIGADFYTITHEGSRKIFLSARKFFDNVRQITKPFAEGKFAEVINTRVERLASLIETLDLGWLKNIRDFLEKSDSWVKPIDWLIDRFYGLNSAMSILFGDGTNVKKITQFTSLLYGFKKWSNQQAPKIIKIVKNLKTILGTFSPVLGDITKYAKELSRAVGELVSKGLTKIENWTSKLKSNGQVVSFVEKLRDGLKILKEVFASFGRLGQSAVGVIFSVISKLYEKLHDSGAFSAFSKGVSLIAEIIIKVNDKIALWLDKLRQIIDKSEPVRASLDKIGGGFGWIGERVSSAYEHLKAFFKYLFGIKEGETIFTKFGQLAKRAGELIGASFENIRTAISESFSEDGVGGTAIDIASALFTVLIGYRKLESVKFARGRFGRVLTSLTNGLKEVYNIIRSTNLLQIADDVETLLRRTGGALRAFSDNLNSKSLINIGLAVSALAFGLILLASVTESGNLPSALIGLTATMGVLIGALFALKKIMGPGILKDIAKGWKGLAEVFKNSISKYFDALALKEMATAALIFAGALAIMAVAVAGLAWAFSKLKLGDIALAVGTLVVMGVLLTGMIAWLTKATEKVGMLDSTKFVAMGVALAALAVGIVILSTAVAGLAWAFSKLKLGDIALAVGTLVVLMGALVGTIVALNYWTKEIGGVKLTLIAAAMIGMAVAVLLLAAAAAGLAYAFQGLDNAWYAVGAVLAIGTMLIAMAGTLAFLSSMLEKVPILKILSIAAAMVLMGVAIGIVAASAVAFAIAIQVGGFAKTVGGMVAVLVAMAAAVGVLSLLGPKILIGAVAILAVGYAIKIACEGFVALAEGMIVLAGALNMLPSDGSLDIIGIGLKSVGKGLAKLAWAAMLFNWGDTEAFSSLIPLATALYELGKVDIPTLADKHTGLPALAKALESFGSIFGGIGSVGAHLAAGNIGLLEAGAAFGALGMGLQDLAPGLEAFNGVENLDNVIANIEALNYAITGLSDFSYSEMYKTMPKLAESLQTIITSLDGLSSEKIRLISDLGEAISNAFSSENGSAEKTLAKELKKLAKTISNNADAFIEESLKIPGYIGEGIEEAQAEMNNALLKMLYDAGKEADSQQLKDNWNTIGGNIAIGIANGISSRTAEAAEAMRNLAYALQTSFTVSLEIRSPSGVFEKLAEYVPEGAAAGIQNGTPKVVSAMAGMIALMVNMMDQASSQAQSMDMSPRLMPVMDMANMQRDMAYANRMFSNTALGSFGGVTGLRVNGDAISYNMQNNDVVAELKHLETRVSQLGEAFEKMQMVLDTGVLVGQIAQPMNNQLGVIAMRERRQ